MKKIVCLICGSIAVLSGLTGCQSIDLKRGWDSVPVAQSRIEVYFRAPINNPTRIMPRDDYWYKHQDNYRPGT